MAAVNRIATRTAKRPHPPSAPVGCRLGAWSLVRLVGLSALLAMPSILRKGLPKEPEQGDTIERVGLPTLRQSGAAIVLKLVAAFATRSLVGRILVDHHVDRGRPMAGQDFGASEAESAGSPSAHPRYIRTTA
jgi:hypothetical protein